MGIWRPPTQRGRLETAASGDPAPGIADGLNPCVESTDLEADGLVRRVPGGLEVTNIGRLFIRNIAMRFDNQLAPVGERRHSRTI